MSAPPCHVSITHACMPSPPQRPVLPRGPRCATPDCGRVAGVIWVTLNTPGALATEDNQTRAGQPRDPRGSAAASGTCRGGSAASASRKLRAMSRRASHPSEALLPRRLVLLLLRRGIVISLVQRLDLRAYGWEGKQLAGRPVGGRWLAAGTGGQRVHDGARSQAGGHPYALCQLRPRPETRTFQPSATSTRRTAVSTAPSPTPASASGASPASSRPWNSRRSQGSVKPA